MPQSVSIVSNVVKGLILSTALVAGCVSTAAGLPPVVEAWNGDSGYSIGR